MGWKDYRCFSAQLASPTFAEHSLNKSLEEHVRSHWDVEHSYMLKSGYVLRTIDVARLFFVALQEVDTLMRSCAEGSNCYQWLVRLYDHLSELHQWFVDLESMFDTTHV